MMSMNEAGFARCSGYGGGRHSSEIMPPCQIGRWRPVLLGTTKKEPTPLGRLQSLTRPHWSNRPTTRRYSGRSRWEIRMEPTPTGLAGKMPSMWSMRDLSAGPTQERGSQVLALAGVSTSRAESGGLGGADAGSKRSSGSSAGQLGNELNRRLMLTRRVSRWQRMTRCRCVAGPACRKGSARLR